MSVTLISIVVRGSLTSFQKVRHPRNVNYCVTVSQLKLLALWDNSNTVSYSLCSVFQSTYILHVCPKEHFCIIDLTCKPTPTRHVVSLLPSVTQILLELSCVGIEAFLQISLTLFIIECNSPDRCIWLFHNIFFFIRRKLSSLLFPSVFTNGCQVWFSTSWACEEILGQNES